MSFDSYKTIGEVLQEFTITATEANYILETDTVIREAFKEDLEFCLREFTVEESEYAICETIIFPLLKEVYRQYRDKFTLWSHKAITYDQQLTGIPDYILAKRSPLGKQIFEKPYFVAVEAKKDDFIKGWGQCLAEMVAIQKINDQSEQTIFGIVSNGQLWQFGKLKGNLYTREINNYTISDLERVYSAINYIFSQCELELESDK
ncbi:hypothetical protein [Moorena sp. SIO4G3]|uniref:hypothetical protein n=1 Tax=Moorena sp. SIO4G3 TaxID=2607821 RepID=UPI00142A65E8|nr:hypothetical protein [Moorena sp. SIO4G3]NEO77719.1 hypothetical protein [Moorena sp. SIO4G3]